MKERIRHKSEDLYRVLYESVHDGIYRSTPEGKILAANPALVQMLGYSSEEELKKLNIGKDLYVSSAERKRFLSEIEKKGRLRDTELVLRKKDGTEIIVLENSHAVHGDSGELLYYEGTLTEITDRKRAVEALKESENRYHTLVETLQDGLSLFDFTGRMLYFNSQKKKMLGYSSDKELFKVNVFDMIHPDDRKLAQKAFRELMARGSVSGLELRTVKKDGTWFWAEFSSSLVNDSSGKPVYVMDSMRDISERKQTEEQLMILKHSIDVHYDGAFWLDNKSCFIYVNDAACRDTGYSRKELIGMHISRINSQYTAEAEKLIWDNLRKKGSFTMESIHTRKDKSVYPAEIVVTFIRFGGKEYACGFARDITERKKTAEDIRMHLEQLRQIIDLVPSYIFAKDVDGRFLLANKALADVFGLEPEEIQGKNDSDYGATPDQVSWYRKHDREVIHKGIPVYIPEEQVLRKDGQLGWFQTVKIPYRHPGYDKPAILGVATEITERKQIEDELRKSEKRFRKLFESHAAVKLLIDPETREIIDANKAAADFYGWPVSKLRKMKLTDISMSPHEEIMKRIELSSGKKGAQYESVNRLADGSLRDVEVFTSKIEIDGSYYIHSIVFDITEKKKILRDLIAAKEKAEESDRLKTAFLHNISHEIRTPMNAIVGFTSLLESTDLTEESRRQYIDIIFQSSHQLLSIISDIVDISNIETGHTRLSYTEVKLASLMHSIYDQYRLRIEIKGLDFKLVLPPSKKDLIIMTDETKLVQIISNLINNAVKFTTKGSIEFGYRAKSGMVEFFVKDTGTGIKEEELEKIFERFYQAENTYNRKTEGAGLGLSICMGYVNLLGGKLWVNSAPGTGSEFLFTIPKRNQGEKKGKNIISHSPELNRKTTGKRVLIAEDDDFSFRLIRDYLKGENLNITRALNGSEAVDMFTNVTEKPELVIMDIKMPVMDGFEAVRKIREKDEITPVIALTAYVNEGDKERALASGFNGYLTKPIVKTQLLKFLKTYLHQ